MALIANHMRFKDVDQMRASTLKRFLRLPRFDDEMLMDCFRRLGGETEPGRVNFRYVIALLLMRRKRLRFADVRMDGDKEIMALRCSKTRTLYQVVNPLLSDEELQAVQDEVFQVLGWE